MTGQGLLIPKEELAPWGEVVVEVKPYQLIIRPRSVAQLTYGILKGDPKWLEQIIEDVEIGGAAIDYGEPPTGLHAEGTQVVGANRMSGSDF
jgi:hypothetical protein